MKKLIEIFFKERKFQEGKARKNGRKMFRRNKKGSVHANERNERKDLQELLI
jgi:hypothetical protein